MSNCQVCNNEINLSLIDMGLMPIANDLLHLKKSKSKLYPLQVLLCEGCKLFQLSVRIDPQHIFTDYFYHSSYSSSWLNHARTFAENVKRNIDFNENNFIMEIASNDGYLLKNFNTIPYCDRYLDTIYNNKVYKPKINKLAELGMINQYPPLYCSKGGMTAQYEHTVYLKEGKKIIFSSSTDY